MEFVFGALVPTSNINVNPKQTIRATAGDPPTRSNEMTVPAWGSPDRSVTGVRDAGDVIPEHLAPRGLANFWPV
jgi:hypothetical protein